MLVILLWYPQIHWQHGLLVMKLSPLIGKACLMEQPDSSKSLFLLLCPKGTRQLGMRLDPGNLEGHVDRFGQCTEVLGEILDLLWN